MKADQLASSALRVESLLEIIWRLRIDHDAPLPNAPAQGATQACGHYLWQYYHRMTDDELTATWLYL